mgnify:CR=1 FL=1
MRRNRRVKIVATLGPASTNEETMRHLFDAGADVFRVNMSHATHEGLREVHGIVRKLQELRERHNAILIATGVYKARDLKAPGAGLGNIVQALDYLVASNRKGLGDEVPEFAIAVAMWAAIGGVTGRVVGRSRPGRDQSAIIHERAGATPPPADATPFPP